MRQTVLKTLCRNIVVTSSFGARTENPCYQDEDCRLQLPVVGLVAVNGFEFCRLAYLRVLFWFSSVLGLYKQQQDLVPTVVCCR